MNTFFDYSFNSMSDYCSNGIRNDIFSSFESMPVITQSDVLIVIYDGVFLGAGVGIVVKSGGAIDGNEMLAI